MLCMQGLMSRHHKARHGSAKLPATCLPPEPYAELELAVFCMLGYRNLCCRLLALQATSLAMHLAGGIPRPCVLISVPVLHDAFQNF